MDIHTNEIAQFMRGFQPKTRARPKQRGRPRTRNEELFARVIRGHRATAKWFEEEHGRAARSDIELFTAFREHVLEASQADARAVQVLSLGYTLKTVQNLLGEARRFYREHPEKHPFLGVDAPLTTESNHIIEMEEIE
ncbi:MAG: hypothetical protein ACK4NM_07655 [Hydrogenophaga sp.]